MLKKRAPPLPFEGVGEEEVSFPDPYLEDFFSLASGEVAAILVASPPLVKGASPSLLRGLTRSKAVRILPPLQLARVKGFPLFFSLEEWGIFF